MAITWRAWRKLGPLVYLRGSLLLVLCSWADRHYYARGRRLPPLAFAILDRMIDRHRADLERLGAVIDLVDEFNDMLGPDYRPAFVYTQRRKPPAPAAPAPAPEPSRKEPL